MKKFLYKKVIVIFIIFITIIFYTNFTFAAQAYGLRNNYIFNVINKASGKCLNVNYGTDANGTNVTQYTRDGSLEQRFKLVYTSSRDSYKLYAMCSSNGTNRVLDVLRVGGSASGAINSGCNVDIWAPNDDEAQDFIIIHRGNGYYSLHPRVNDDLALTTNGTGNGSGAGTSPSSIGNVYVSTYTGSDNQLWSFDDTTVICYYYNDAGDRTPTHTQTEYYTTRMGYNYRGKLNEKKASFLSDLQNSEIFVFHGHGSPGILSLDGSDEITISDFSSFSNTSLNNVKIALIYSCFGAAVGNVPASIFSEIDAAGAKCTVAWDVATYVSHVNYWNQEFFKKIYTDSTEREIYRGFQHADYWLNDVYGQNATDIMQGHRYEGGDITQLLYK